MPSCLSALDRSFSVSGVGGLRFRLLPVIVRFEAIRPLSHRNGAKSAETSTTMTIKTPRNGFITLPPDGGT